MDINQPISLPSPPIAILPTMDPHSPNPQADAFNSASRLDLCQADLPECAEIDDELDCPAEPADEEYPESSGMSTVLVRNVLTSLPIVGGEMRKTTTTPILHPLPLLLPTSANHLIPPVSFALVAPRITILQWELKPLLCGKGNRLPSEPPVAQMMKRSPGSGERRLA